MYVKKIELRQFRNMENLTVCPCPGINVIYGDNAQGKTNLVEAIWLFTGSKSFRGAKDREMVHFDQEKAEILMDFWGENRDQSAQIVLAGQKKVFLNEIELESLGKLAGHFYSVVFSPAHLSLVREGPAFRRKFLDTALCQIVPKYEPHLKEYQRILDQRNALLKDLERFPQLEDTIDIWDQHLAKSGAWIMYCRFQYVKRMVPAACQVYSGISGDQEKLDIQVESTIGAQDNMDREALYHLFYKVLRENRNTDMVKHSTSFGPHRDDMIFWINGQQAKLYGSQGQQRSCVLALKMAECAIIEEMTGETPVILLDDVMSELDSQRRSYLLNRIKGRQVFITCCDQESVQYMEQGKTFHIRKGMVESETDSEGKE